MTQDLAAVEHVVVLMLENRPLDNLLGPTFAPDVRRVNEVFPSATHDPGELFQFMHQQIYGLCAPLPVNTPLPKDPRPGPLGAMCGFVQNYLTTLGDYGYFKALLPFILHACTAEQLPVTTALARAFAVVDTYFASCPCQTIPNRCFAQLGTAQGFVNNDSCQGSYDVHRSNAPYRYA